MLSNAALARNDFFGSHASAVDTVITQGSSFDMLSGSANIVTLSELNGDHQDSLFLILYFALSYAHHT